MGPKDEDMQKFLNKLKNQVNKGGDWLCHSCGVDVSGDLQECHMCNAVRPGETDWICRTCTFVNAEDDGVCQMCLSEAPHANNNNNANKMSWKSEETWSCPACKYHNTKTKCCRMCGYELGTKITPQNDEGSASEPDQEDNVLLEIARNNHHKQTIDVNKEKQQQSNKGKETPISPNKHVSANSGNDDVFGAVAGWDLPDAPKHDVINGKEEKVKKNGGGAVGGGMVMMMRPKKKKKEQQKDDEEEDSIEESSVEEVVDEDIVAFDDFDIPMMDEHQLKENADVINIQKDEPQEVAKEEEPEKVEKVEKAEKAEE